LSAGPGTHGGASPRPPKDFKNFSSQRCYLRSASSFLNSFSAPLGSPCLPACKAPRAAPATCNPCTMGCRNKYRGLKQNAGLWQQHHARREAVAMAAAAEALAQASAAAAAARRSAGAKKSAATRARQKRDARAALEGMAGAAPQTITPPPKSASEESAKRVRALITGQQLLAINPARPATSGGRARCLPRAEGGALFVLHAPARAQHRDVPQIPCHEGAGGIQRKQGRCSSHERRRQEQMSPKLAQGDA
jgi:hypothetical protein